MKKIFDNSQKGDVGLFLPNGFGPYKYEIRTVQLDRIVDELWRVGSTQIKDTPHYKYLTGDRGPLERYFESCRGYTWARKGTPAEGMKVSELIGEFDSLIHSEKSYLEPPYENHYIIVRSNWSCIDGLRRSCVLLANGVEEAPVAWVL